jgi:hypothetical protein
MYFATGATHAPHHVPPQWIAKYKGKFSGGWDRLRQETFERQKMLGAIPAETKLTPRPAEIPAWDSMSADQFIPDAAKPGTGGKSILSVDGKKVAEGPHPEDAAVRVLGRRGRRRGARRRDQRLARLRAEQQRVHRQDRQGDGRAEVIVAPAVAGLDIDVTWSPPRGCGW